MQARHWYLMMTMVGMSLLLAGILSSAMALTPIARPADLSDARAFTIARDGVEREISLGEIETLQLYRVETASPWELQVQSFDGVLLRDLLAHLGLADSPAITVRAIDGYTQTVPREDWQTWSGLLATRSHGKPLRRRDKGPTRLVYPLSDMPELDTAERKLRWIWLIDRIER